MRPALGILCAISAALAQSPTAAQVFEVATIKPVPIPSSVDMISGKMHAGLLINAARVDIGFFSLADLIREAYRVKHFQISGPNWLSNQRFDVQATMPAGASKDQVPEMLQALLAERFKLSLHRETREQSIYELGVAKGGPKLQQPAAAAEPATPPTGNTGSNQVQVTQNASGIVMRDAEGGLARTTMAAGGLHIEFQQMTIPRLAELLSRLVDRPIVDTTNLTGKYDWALDVSMEEAMKAARSQGLSLPASLGGGEAAKPPADSASEPTGSVFTTLQRYGLKLEPKRYPLEFLVIDHIEKLPTAN